MSYPSSLDSFTTKNTGDVIAASHINDLQLAVAALEVKLGVDASAVATTIDYLLKNTASSNPGHKHTLSSLSDFSVSGPTAGQSLVYNGSVWVNTAGFKFGGTGADGALTVSSGTTTIDCANAAVVTKNYTSISITGTGKVVFSNPNTNGTLIILKSQGGVTLTSSSSPNIDVGSMGSAGTSGGATPFGATSSASAAQNWISITGDGGGGGCSSGQGQPAGTAGTAPSLVVTQTSLYRFVPWYCGAGGSGGQGGASGAGVGGAGGAGAGSLIIECGGAWNFTSSIFAKGVNGVAGTNGSGTGGGGGGGGGAGGTVIVMYNTLTANSGTITVTGGSSGAGGTGTSTAGGSGGGGGAGAAGAGSAGIQWSSGSNGVSGGAGNNGYSDVFQNVLYA